MDQIPKCFYRVSIKALILDETKTKFILCREKKGTWDFPGGGLDFGEQPVQGLQRELFEELGIPTKSIAEHPSYFVIAEKAEYHCRLAHVFYDVELEHFDFIASDECLEMRFFSKEDVLALPNILPNVQAFIKQF